jgi:hypothetical protein
MRQDLPQTDLQEVTVDLQWLLLDYFLALGVGSLVLGLAVDALVDGLVLLPSLERVSEQGIFLFELTSEDAVPAGVGNDQFYMLLFSDGLLDFILLRLLSMIIKEFGVGAAQMDGHQLAVVIID